MCDVFKVAKKICESQKWQVTNLRLQKILYIAQVLSLGLRNGKHLFNAEIQAWKYGPVVPEVYQRFKFFGSDYIPEIAFGENLTSCSEDECAFIDAVANMTKNIKDWELVGLTHRDGSAWKKVYSNNRNSCVISEEDMKKEFEDLWSK
ncbi:MAG: SocA family protein [Alphaproteobacteria bacterium]|nr:SocA family protein [Alphaproteobacteria bacterium]